MCGRAYISRRHIRYIEEKQPDLWATWQKSKYGEPKENGDIRPTQALICARITQRGPELLPMRWGFARPYKNAIINATAEKLTGKFWGKAAKERRCTVFVSGYFEWVLDHRGHKDPRAFELPQKGPMWLAGLWEESAEFGPCVAIVTCEAAGHMKEMHGRMPVILDAAGVESWLNPDAEAEQAQQMSHPYKRDIVIFPCLKPSHDHIPELEDIQQQGNNAKGKGLFG